MAFIVAGPKSDLLDTAIERYTSLTFPHAAGAATGTPADALAALTINLDSADESHPQLATNESYVLAVHADGAVLNAPTVYAALRGLESFSQLVRFSFTQKSYQVANAPWDISDAPRFPHRGLMIDSARHFETLESIRSIIDSLPFAKLNVLHCKCSLVWFHARLLPTVDVCVLINVCW